MQSLQSQSWWYRSLAPSPFFAIPTFTVSGALALALTTDDGSIARNSIWSTTPAEAAAIYGVRPTPQVEDAQHVAGAAAILSLVARLVSVGTSSI